MWYVLYRRTIKPLFLLIQGKTCVFWYNTPMRKTLIRLGVVLLLFSQFQNLTLAQVDMSELNVVKVTGNIFEMKGQLLSIIDGTGSMVKVFVPVDTPIYEGNQEVSFDELNPEDKIEVITHNKNVALSIDIKLNVDITPTPEPEPTQSNTSNNLNDNITNALGVASSFNSAGMKLSIAAAGVFIGIVLLAFGLPWIASLIQSSIDSRQKKANDSE